MSSQKQAEQFIKTFHDDEDGWKSGNVETLVDIYIKLLTRFSHDDVQEMMTDIIVTTMGMYQ